MRDRLVPGVAALARVAALAAAVALTTTAAADAPAGAMPALTVETLSGKQQVLPGDLAQGPCLFIVGYSRASRAETSGWSRRLAQEPQRLEGVSIYNVAVIEDVPKLVRGFVVRGMRRGVPEPLHERFLLATQQSQEWKHMTAYAKPDAAYLVLTNGQHEVLWHGSGPATGPTWGALLEQVHALDERQ